MAAPRSHKLAANQSAMHGRDTEDDSDDYYDPSSEEDDDEEEEERVNARIRPWWEGYRRALECRGFLLDTCREVRAYYERFAESDKENASLHNSLGYQRACKGKDNALCKDAGLPDSLFRGTCMLDRTRVIIKAVHLRSREFDIIRYICSPALRQDPLNHCIPVRDLIELKEYDVGLIVMEEWSPELITETPCNLGEFLGALRQCIEHVVFLHANHIAHLDISIRNIVTDYAHHYACIDYETSRRFDAASGMPPRVVGIKSTEVPPDIERGEWSDPYKIDIYALAVLILRACQLTGYSVPELGHLVRPMLHYKGDDRPSSREVLHAFNYMVSRMPPQRLSAYAENGHSSGP